MSNAFINSGKIKKETKCFSMFYIHQMRKTQQNLYSFLKKVLNFDLKVLNFDF